MQVIAELEKSYRRGEFGRVVFTCDELLQDPAYTPVKAHVLFWKGMARESTGPVWYGEAISCYREGISLAGRDRPLKARIMAALAVVYAQLGDCASLDKLMREYDRTARDGNPNVLHWGAIVWYNYGVALDNAFKYDEAAQAFTKTHDLASNRAGLEHVYGLSVHNLGGVELARGNLDGALHAMEQAEGLLSDEGWGHKKASRRAEYYLAAGDLIEAQQKVTAALLHPKVDDMTRADLCYTWAQILLKLGRPAEAREKALLALDHAVKAVHYPGIHKINCFLQQLSSDR